MGLFYFSRDILADLCHFLIIEESRGGKKVGKLEDLSGEEAIHKILSPTLDSV